jgi:hypothetical protein
MSLMSTTPMENRSMSRRGIWDVNDKIRAAPALPQALQRQALGRQALGLHRFDTLDIY